MSPFRSFPAIYVIACAALFPCLAEAADVSTLQTALSLARDNMENTQRKYEADAQAVTQQQQIVADRKKQLADETSRLDKMEVTAEQSRRQYLQAQQQYDKAQARLDAAWKQ